MKTIMAASLAAFLLATPASAAEYRCAPAAASIAFLEAEGIDVSDIVTVDSGDAAARNAISAHGIIGIYTAVAAAADKAGNHFLVLINGDCFSAAIRVGAYDASGS